MANVAKFFVNSETSDVPLAPDAVKSFWMTSMTMPVGKYIFNGIGYDCTRKGLYRFWAKNPAAPVIHNRIVWRSSPPTGDGDVYALISAICWNHVHADGDQFLTGQALSNAGMTHKWRLRCGYIVNLTLWYMQVFGFQARSISLTSHDPINGVDDGHIVFELWHENKWKLWDLSDGCYFTFGGVHLSADEIISHGVLNCVRVRVDGDQDRGASVANRWCMSSYRDLAALGTDAGLNAWLAKTYQAWTL